MFFRHVFSVLNRFCWIISVFTFFHLALCVELTHSPWCRKRSPDHNDATTILHSRKMLARWWVVRFFLPWFDSLQRCFLAEIKQAAIRFSVRCGFRLATLSQRPDQWSQLPAFDLLDGLPISTKNNGPCCAFFKILSWRSTWNTFALIYWFLLLCPLSTDSSSVYWSKHNESGCRSMSGEIRATRAQF